MRQNLPALSAAAFFAGLTVALLYPLSFHAATTVRDAGDPLLQTWMVAWMCRAVVSDPLRLYEANIFYPFPSSLAFSEAPLGTLPVSAPVFWATGNPVLAYNASLLVGFWLSAVGAYLLARRLTGSSPAGLVAGTVFAFAPYKMSHLSHLNLLSSQWIPLTLLFLHRATVGRRWADYLAASACFCMLALSSFYYAFIMTTAVALFAAYYGLTLRPFADRGLAAKAVASSSLAALVMAPFALPYLAVRDGYGFERSTGEVHFYSAGLRDHLISTPENVLYGEFSKTRIVDGERILFPGAAAVALAAAGVVTLRGASRGVGREGVGVRRGVAVELTANADQGFYLTLAAFAFVMTFGLSFHFGGQDTGFPLPYSLFYKYFPGFKAMRCPARFDVLVVLALAVLAGYGSARLMSLLPPGGGGRALRAVAVALVLNLMISEYASVPLSTVTVEVGDAVPQVYRWLGRQAPGTPLIELPADTKWQAFRYEYFSTYHWQPIVNGESGFRPSAYEDLTRTAADFPGPAAVDLLRGLGVQLVVVHGSELPGSRWSEMKASCESSRDITLAATYGEDRVYRLNAVPGAGPAVRAVAGDGHRERIWRALAQVRGVVRSSKTQARSRPGRAEGGAE